MAELKTDMHSLRLLLAATKTNHWNSSKSRDDFGPPETTDCHLRQKHLIYDMPFLDNKEYFRHAFGLYLGEHNAKWIVAIKDLLLFQPVGWLEYDTLEQLKQEWELD